MSFKLFACSLLSVFFASASYAQISGSESDPVVTTDIVAGLFRPWDMAFLSASKALVTEKEGGLQRVNLIDGSKISVSGLPDDLDNRNKTGIGDNAGLFAVVLDPEFDDNAWVYLSYAAANSTGSGTTTKVVRGKLRANELTALETLLVAEPYSGDRYHYGGGLVFGPDGRLYITVGERLFSEIDQPTMPIAQDLKDRRGKVYRLNPDGSIPDDNPEFSEPGIAGLYAVGIRAAQGLTLDPKTGDIWFSEHGTRQGDEINLLMPGANYGWPIHTDGGYRHVEYEPPALKDRQFADPAWSWPETVAPTGLTFYYGNEFKGWSGNLLVAGLSKGSLWRMTVVNKKVVAGEELMTHQRIRLRNVKQAPDGKLYLITDEANGRILRLEPASSSERSAGRDSG